MIRWRTFLLGAALLSVSTSALALTGDLFARGERTPLFSVERTERVDGGDRTITVRYANPDGTEAARETAVLRGERLVRSEFVQRQIGEAGAAEVAGSRVTVRYGKAGAKPDEGTETVNLPLVTPATLPRVVAASWARLARGEALEIRLVAFARRETVGFEVERAGTDDRGRVRIRVRPTSPFIRVLVDPLVLTFDADGQRLRAYEGRTALKRRDGTSWRDFDGLTVYRDGT